MRKLVVIIDVAHGQEVKGKSSPDGLHKEYKWSREVSAILAETLKKHNFRIEYTNTSDNEIGLSRRKEIANNIKISSEEVKFLISLHNNAAGADGNWHTARGFEIFTSPGKTRSDLFAEVIMKNLRSDFPTSQGYKHRVDMSDGDMDKEANFTVLLGNYSAVLLEWLFQDNKEDIALLNSKDVNLALVNSLVRSLIYIDENLESLML